MIPTLGGCLKFLLLCDLSGLCFFSVDDVQRRLASTRDCRGSTRLRRLVLAAAEVLAGSAIDEKFQAPPLTSDTHSLFLYVAFWFLCSAEKQEYMAVTYQLDNFSCIFRYRTSDFIVFFFNGCNSFRLVSFFFGKKGSARLFLFDQFSWCFFKLTLHGRSLYAV